MTSTSTSGVDIVFMTCMLQRNFITCLAYIKALGFEVADIMQSKLVFVPFRDRIDAQDVSDNLAGIAMDFDSRKFYLVAPKYSSTDATVVEHYEKKLLYFAGLFNDFIESFTAVKTFFVSSQVFCVHGDNDPQCPNNFHHLTNNYDSGIFIVTIFDYLYHVCPIHIRMEDWPRIRRGYAESLLRGRIPTNV